MIGAVRLHGLLILCCALGACYNPSYGDCQVSCASGTCPSGLECQAGMCRAPGMSGQCMTPDGGGDGGGEAVALDMLDDAQLDSLCDYSVRCGQFEDVTSCKAVYGNLIVPQTDVISAVTAGSVIYHGDKAKQCLDSQASRGCERWKFTSNRATDPSCSAVFEGTRHASESCAIAEQCISMNCMFPSSCTGNPSGTCCEGMCVGDEPPGPRNVGEACTYRDSCANGYCDQLTGVCAGLKTEGMPCQYGDQCADGLTCDPTIPNAVCQTPVATNGPCSSSNVCLELGDVCRNGACMTGGVTGSSCGGLGECQQLHQCLNSVCALPSEIGGSCQNLGMCTTGYCQQPFAACVAKVTNGGACDPNMGPQQCESGYCDVSLGMCMTKPVCN